MIKQRSLLISGVLATVVTTFGLTGVSSSELDLPGLNQRIDNIDARTTNNEEDIQALQQSTGTAPAEHVEVPAAPTSTTTTTTSTTTAPTSTIQPEPPRLLRLPPHQPRRLFLLRCRASQRQRRSKPRASAWWCISQRGAVDEQANQVAGVGRRRDGIQRDGRISRSLLRAGH